MEREFLKNLDLGNGVRLSKDVIDAIMAEYGKTVTPLRKQVTDLTQDRDDWKTRAETAEGIVAQLPKDQDPAQLLEALNKAQTDLANATTEYEAKLAERDYNDALRAALDGMKFSSAAARRDVESQLRAAKLPLQDGQIMGLGDKIAKIRETDAEAFAPDNAPEKDNAPTDRAQRRAAIAENLDSLKGD